ncbi:MAG: hypothetical protein ABIO40_03545 [Devosia sp.]
MNLWLALTFVALVAIGIVAFFWRSTRIPTDGGSESSGIDNNISGGSDGGAD